MLLLWKYLQEKGKVIGIFTLFCGVFATVFALYHVPLGAVAYPAMLCALAGFILLALDFARTRRRHAELERLASFPASVPVEFPEESDIIAQDYQAILQAMQARTADMEETAAARYRDMVDYYTIWAHQIKTPIAAMELNLQNTDTAQARKLRADLRRVEQYVEMVLAFLRLDSETSDYVFREHSLDKIIRGAAKKFSQEFIGRKIGLQYEPLNLTLITDDKWLSFVLEQIISNALKYTRKGSIRIYLCKPKILCIQDTGIGIAPEDLPRIFEKGYTGCNGRADKRASGIGLYLCKRVCDNLGIGISAESEMGKGTTMKLNLEQYETKIE